MLTPILCLILFIGLVEYRLKRHLDDVERRVDELTNRLNNSNEVTSLENDQSSSNE